MHRLHAFYTFQQYLSFPGFRFTFPALILFVFILPAFVAAPVVFHLAFLCPGTFFLFVRFSWAQFAREKFHSPSEFLLARVALVFFLRRPGVGFNVSSSNEKSVVILSFPFLTPPTFYVAYVGYVLALCIVHRVSCLLCGMTVRLSVHLFRVLLVWVLLDAMVVFVAMCWCLGRYHRYLDLCHPESVISVLYLLRLFAGCLPGYRHRH